MYPLNRPEIIVAKVKEKMDAGRITDETTRMKVAEMLKALVLWTEKLAGTG